MKIALPCMLLALTATVVGCGQESPQPAAVGDKVPAFDLPLVDANQADATISNQTLEGDVVVLNFWSTSCSNCRKEIPELNQLHGDGKGSVRVIGIALDENSDLVARCIDSSDIKYPVLLGNPDVFEQFDGYSIPYTLIIDHDRKIRHRFFGRVGIEDLNNSVKSVQSGA